MKKFLKMRMRTVLAILVCSSVAVTGCASFGNNSPGQNVAMVLRGLSLAVNGVQMVLTNFQIGTPEELAEINSILNETSEDVVRLVDKITAILDRDPDVKDADIVELRANAEAVKKNQAARNKAHSQ